MPGKETGFLLLGQFGIAFRHALGAGGQFGVRTSTILHALHLALHPGLDGLHQIALAAFGVDHLGRDAVAFGSVALGYVAFE